MTKVYQTKYGKDTGNCFAACLASVLDLPIESIPEEIQEDKDWYFRLMDFCKARDLAMMYASHPMGECMPFNMIGIGAFTVKDNGGVHAVVISTRLIERDGAHLEWGTTVIHDPNQSPVPLEVDQWAFYIFITKAL